MSASFKKVHEKTKQNWVQTNGLRIVPEKTESVMLTGRKKHGEIRFEIGGRTIHPKPSVKYLGVHFDKNLSFTLHVKETVKKAERVITALRRLFPRIGGPREQKRRLIASVGQSIILYAAPIWSDVLKYKYCQNMLNSANRRLAMGICRGYRDISSVSAEILARLTPMPLLIEERRLAYRATKGEKKAIREERSRRWQERWNLDRGNLWLHEVIPNIEGWLEREHGEIGFHLTQFLTGHGCYQSYLCRIGKAENDICNYCIMADTAEHSIFVCERWKEMRQTTEKLLKERVGRETIINTMLESEENWIIVNEMIEAIMTEKEDDERRRERE